MDAREPNLCELPQDLTPLNLRAYLSNAFDMCGCAEIGYVVSTLTTFLTWAGSPQGRLDYDRIDFDLGLYYVFIGRLNRLDLVCHGVSCRCPSLTSEGKRLLSALMATSADAIDNAGGEAYDGCWYDPD